MKSHVGETMTLSTLQTAKKLPMVGDLSIKPNKLFNSSLPGTAGVENPKSDSESPRKLTNSGNKAKKVDKNMVSKEFVPVQVSSWEVFVEFLKKNEDNSFDASGIFTHKCYRRWLSTRQKTPKLPEESFRRAITAHIRGTNGRKPFSEAQEAAILTILRRKEKWNCFDTVQSIGKLGYQKLGFHEEKKLRKKENEESGSTSGFLKMKSKKHKRSGSVSSSPRKKARSQKVEALESLGLPLRSTDSQTDTDTDSASSASPSPIPTPTALPFQGVYPGAHINPMNMMYHAYNLAGMSNIGCAKDTVNSNMHVNPSNMVGMNMMHNMQMGFCAPCMVSRVKTMDYYSYLNYLHVTANMLVQANKNTNSNTPNGMEQPLLMQRSNLQF